MHLVFALPRPAETGGGGGADYIDGLAAGLRENGLRADILTGSDPAFPAGCIPIVDGMLLPRLHHRLDELAERGAVAIVHHIAAAASRDDASRAATLSLARTMLPRMRRVIATSGPVATRLRDECGVAVHALPPGQRDAPPSQPDPASPLILAVGVLTRRKGHDRLLRAASRLLDLPWTLVIAGDAQREPDHPAELHALATELGLADRATIVANPAHAMLESHWRRATAFALATRWEGYPSAVAEALQRGIPAVVTSGANADTLLPPEAGAICPLDDMATFGKCLRRLLFDTDLRTSMAAAALAAGQALPRWTTRAREFAALLEPTP